MSNPQYYSSIDFRLNRSLWNTWGPAAALPFRLKNLTEIQALLDERGCSTSLYGKTLLNASNDSHLRADHDDDLIVKCASLKDFVETHGPALEEIGFSLIRDSSALVSFERYGRYIDFHLPPDRQCNNWGTDILRVDGYPMHVHHDYQQLLAAKYPDLLDSRLRGRLYAKARGVVRMRRLYPSLARQALANSPTKMKNMVKSSRWFAGSLKLVGLQDFLTLQIDGANATNWTWRRAHYDPLFREGENFAAALERLKGAGGVAVDELEVVEVDTTKPFIEPLNLSRRFWHEGNNFFVYPFRYGFRHSVLPYNASNLYILSGCAPKLFSRSYFEGLPRVEEHEMKPFLRRSPIEITNGCVTSGRHRATAMLGRIARGEPYEPMWAYVK